MTRQAFSLLRAVVRKQHRRQAGFGLVELLIALTLGLVLVLGVVQVFLASKQTFMVQRTAALLQEDARYLLARLSQELRMLNMYGCLDLTRLPASIRATIPVALDTPLVYSEAGGMPALTLITAVPTSESFSVATTRRPGDYGARWLLVSNCRDTEDLRISDSTDLAVRPGDLVIPLRQVDYRVNAHALQIRTNGVGNFQTLLEGVAGLSLSFGLAATGADRHVSGAYVTDVSASQAERIRSIKLALELSDRPANPETGKVLAQQFTQVVALRNRIN